MKAELLEKEINRFLQHKISININNKTVKTGKLILFCIKDFYLVFTLSIAHAKKIFEIPYPYDFTIQDKGITLDYTLKSFSLNMQNIDSYVKLLTPKKPNKYFNSYAEIITVEDKV